MPKAVEAMRSRPMHILPWHWRPRGWQGLHPHALLRLPEMQPHRPHDDERAVLFPGGRGTAHMLKEAQAAKLIVIMRVPAP